MSDLLIRPGLADASLLPRLLAERGDGLVRLRVVLDAHAALRNSSLSISARNAGVPLLIDPQTYFLQDAPASSDPWQDVPFASARAMVPGYYDHAAIDRLIADSTRFQVERDATAVVLPYFFLGRMETGWMDVQASVWRRARPVLADLDVGLPIIAPVALDWSRLSGSSPFARGEQLDRALRALSPDEVALATSKSHLGKKPEDRLRALCAEVARLSAIAPVVAWSQGVLGEACVAAGAVGYETRLGYREALDMTSVFAAHRVPPKPGPRTPRMVYVRPLMRGVAKRTIEAVSANPRIWPSVFCLDHTCCAPGGSAMLGDARMHSVHARRRALDELDAIASPAWRWGAIADRSQVGLDLAARINRLDIRQRVDVTALRGMNALGESLRQGEGQIRTA